MKERNLETKSILKEFEGLGDALGPIGLTYSGGVKASGAACRIDTMHMMHASQACILCVASQGSARTPYLATDEP